jgi:hypothetical protein
MTSIGLVADEHVELLAVSPAQHLGRFSRLLVVVWSGSVVMYGVA